MNGVPEVGLQMLQRCICIELTARAGLGSGHGKASRTQPLKVYWIVEWDAQIEASLRRTSNGDGLDPRSVKSQSTSYKLSPEPSYAAMPPASCPIRSNRILVTVTRRGEEHAVR